MNRGFAGIGEIVLLFAALCFTLTPLPSNEVEHLRLMPAGAVAITLFAASRLLRWWPRYWIAAPETILFGCFVYVANEIANALYRL